MSHGKRFLSQVVDFQHFPVALVFLAGCFGGASLAQDRSGQPRPADDAQLRGEIDRFFGTFSEALAKQDVRAIGQHCDVARTYTEASQAADVKLNLLQRTQMRRALSSGMSSMAFNQGVWLQHRIAEVQFNDDATQAVVVVRARRQDGYGSWLRFRLHEADGTWKMYDIEDLEIGRSLLKTFQMLLVQVAAAELDTSRSLMLFKIAGDALAEEDLSALLAPGERLAEVQLPRCVEGRRWLLVAWTAKFEERPEDALQAAEKVEQFEADMPILSYLRAAVYNDLGQHEKALAAARRFISRLGDDADCHYEIGRALEALGNKKQALEHYRRGLDESPDSADNLGALGRLLPAGRKDEIADRFRRFRRPVDRFEEIAPVYFRAADAESLEVLVRTLRELAPEDTNVTYYAALSRILRDDDDGAVKLLEPILKKESELEDGEANVEADLRFLLELGQPVIAYRAAPDKRFALEYLIGRLMRNERWDEANRVLDEHAKQYPNDHNLHFYRGGILSDSGSYEQAEAEFARAIQAAPEEHWRDWYFECRARCWHRMNKPLEGYRRLEPKDKAFKELADLLVLDGRAAELEALVREHRAHGGPPEHTTMYEAKAKWLAKDYTAAARILDQQRRQVSGQLDEHAQKDWDDTLLRSLVRSGQWEKARQYARDFSTPDDDTQHYEVLVFAAEGNVAACCDAVRRLRERDYWLDRLVLDADIGTALRTPRFADVRKQLDKEPLPSLVLLLPRPLKLTDDRLTDAARRAWRAELSVRNRDGVVPYEEPDDIVRMQDVHNFPWMRDACTARVYVGRLFFTVMSCPQPYFEDPQRFVEDQVADGALRIAVREHEAWVSVDCLWLPEGESAQRAYQLMGKLLCEAVSADDGLALYATERKCLTSYNDDARTALQSDDPLGALKDLRQQRP